RQQGTALQYVSAGDHFDWGGADWEILNPPAGKYTGPGQAADSSVAYVLRLATTPPLKAVFTGDIGKSVASAVARSWSDEQLGSATVFLATHHGSANGSTDTLLDAIHPRWAVLSTGPNSYGHPAEAAIGRLEQHGVTIWCTDANGTIRARIADDGTVTWSATKRSRPWWSTEGGADGTCVNRDH